ncbi:LysR family transcriptional regulator [Rhodococcus sp. 15-725-2-2b]|uniref:LysR family transcriptional regulator n=1 Tax=unclassified Rhodococcus (in: high G+C Gram-positive bacteria) TaxID=192944 RepID=UPI000B9A396B|nr:MULTISPECIES: LysR substrate-binding domain-containing protein [unclassified Rhodococcus (in: high G+C Gram-positive bacteria)]OZC72563.1 LysR family transcriptional regulator [Rhodococcus sp. 06-469-3-2]OZD48789.1 LysR family transcriptional regulator [Rhodococcus sp. 06-1477-1A]OZE03321.1 LysR family transcriptional regulator [Rhodococcus sp. 05-2255-3C]OZE09708.1 LysR family transcriptional regulator [Rhodococcus sp. 05-2255-3B1]OZE14975.1 LysR family transcriptional regulator [Rhodococc
MDIRSLRYALTLAEELHFGRAAQAHFIGAQPFGRRIQELERELGTDLFLRTSRKVELTAAGRRFLPRANRVLADLDALMSVREGERADSVLRVGVLGFGLADSWSATRQLLERHHPQLQLSYVELDWENQYDAVRTGEVDVAILHDVGGAEDLRVEQVMGIERCAVVPTESELADATRLTPDEIRDRPCIRPIGQPGLTAWAAGRYPLHGAEVRSPLNIPSAVAMSGTIGVYAEPARRYLPNPDVRYIALDGPPAIIALASRRQDHREGTAAFRRAVQATTTLYDLASTTEPPDDTSTAHATL